MLWCLMRYVAWKMQMGSLTTDLEHKIQRFLNFNAQLHKSLIKQSRLVILIPRSNSPIAWWLILLHSIQFNLVRCLIVAEIWFWESPSFKILGMYEYCIFLAFFFFLQIVLVLMSVSGFYLSCLALLLFHAIRCCCLANVFFFLLRKKK